MKKHAATALLLIALVTPVVLFLLLRSPLNLNELVAAIITIPVGWLLNVACASVAQANEVKDSSESSPNTLSIAMRFGWICPTVFVTWLVLRFIA
jgi:hypothetical protein